MKKNLKDNKIEIGNYFIQNIKFIKTTGVHESNGLAIFKNIENLNRVSKIKNHKIENHKIFNFVCNHFEIHGIYLDANVLRLNDFRNEQ